MKDLRAAVEALDWGTSREFADAKAEVLRLLDAATPALPEAPAINEVLMCCSKHQGMPYSWAATIQPPTRYRCPICEPQEAQAVESSTAEPSRDQFASQQEAHAVGWAEGYKAGRDSKGPEAAGE